MRLDGHHHQFRTDLRGEEGGLVSNAAHCRKRKDGIPVILFTPSFHVKHLDTRDASKYSRAMATYHSKELADHRLAVMNLDDLNKKARERIPIELKRLALAACGMSAVVALNAVVFVDANAARIDADALARLTLLCALFTFWLGTQSIPIVFESAKRVCAIRASVKQARDKADGAKAEYERFKYLIEQQRMREKPKLTLIKTAACA